MPILIPISPGELIDRITILRLKRDRIPDPAKQARAAVELSGLEALAGDLPASADLEDLTARLQALNGELWDIEDGKRRHEREQRFDAAFIDLARRVYLRNDERAAVKRQIDLLTGSDTGEVKSHG